MHRIGLIGFGTIAADVWDALQGDARSFEWAVLVRDLERKRAGLPSGIQAFDALDDLLAWRPDLVIEAAGQAAVQQYVPVMLRRGLKVIVVSAGALADPALRQAALEAAHIGGSRLIVPSGAVASLDYLGALRGVDTASVVYESRKPPAAWRQELTELGHDPDGLPGELELFRGSAQEAALKYPKNLNVAATLALAGIGLERTEVRVVVDPAVSGNQHRIVVESPLGRLESTLLNSPSPQNPKTSWVVAQSVAHAVRQQFAALVIGG